MRKGGNIGIGKSGKATKFKVKTAVKAPVKGKSMNSAIYHSRRGR